MRMLKVRSSRKDKTIVFNVTGFILQVNLHKVFHKISNTEFNLRYEHVHERSCTYANMQGEMSYS